MDAKKVKRGNRGVLSGEGEGVRPEGEGGQKDK